MNAASSPLILCIDEIDMVRSLPFPTDEFFAAIRECYNSRADEPDYERLTFCLFGVASPTDLIRDTRMTPFNIGRRIELEDFSDSEAAPLARGLGRDERANRSLLARILHWTGGHPYLTQRLCLEVAEDRSVNSPGSVDRLCLSRFLSQRALERDDNLIFVRERLLKSETDRASLLDLYGQVWRGRKILNDETNPLMGRLRLTGATRVVKGRLRVRNRIYARAFDSHWIRMHLPDQERQRQRSAYMLGLARATAMATVVVLALGALTLSALNSEKRAGKAQRLADNRAKQATQLAASLQKALTTVTEQRNRAVRAEQNERVGKRLANKARGQAVSMQRLAEQKTDESRKHLVRLYVANGMRLVDEGNLLESLPWLAEALRLDRGSREREVIDSMRLASVLRLCPRITDLYTPPGTTIGIRVSCDGRYLATGDTSGGVRIWNLGRRSEPIVIRQGGQITFIAFSPDSSRVVTAGSDHTSCVWNSATGRRITPFLRQGDAIQCSVFSPDGRRVATASADGTACVWDALTGRQVSLLRHQGLVNWVEFSPDGSLVATAGNDGSARIWSAATGLPVTPPLRHSHWVYRVAFSPDGRRLATAGGDGTVRLWDASTGQQSASPMNHAGAVYAVAFSRDGRRIVTGSADMTARVWDAATGNPIGPPLKHNGIVTFAAFSPDGYRVVTAGQDQTARVWLATSGQPVTPPLLHGNAVVYAAFLPDGRILTAAQDQIVRIWSLPIRTRIAHWQEVGCRINLAMFSPDSQRLMVHDGLLTVRNLRSKTSSLPLRGVGDFVRANFDPSGRKIAFTRADGTVSVLDSETGTLLVPGLRLQSSVQSVAFSQDGRLLVTGGEDGAACLWDATSLKRIARSSNPGPPVSCVAVSPNGDRFATGCNNGTTYLWDAHTGRLAGPPLTHYGGVARVIFSPEGRHLCTVCADGKAYLWETVSGKQVVPPMGLGSPVVDAVFNGNGRKLMITSRDGNIRLWDTATGESIGLPMHQGGDEPRAIFSPNGRFVLSYSRNGGAKVWDATTGEPITPQLSHGGQIVAAAFHSEGDQVITAEGDGQVDLWDLLPGKRSVENLIRVATLVSGRRVVHESEAEPITGLQLKREQDAFQSAYPKEVARNPEPPGVWQREEAADFARQATNKLLIGRNQDAIDFLDRAIEMDPKQPNNWWNRADLEVGAGRKDLALKDYSMVLSLSLNNWRAWQSRGECHRYQRRWKEAVLDFSRALKIRPDYYALWGGRGYVRLFLGEWRGVVEDTMKAIALNPDDSTLWINRARARVLLGDLSHADQDYAMAIHLQSGLIAPWHERAILQLQRRDLAGYRATCADLVSRFPKNDDAGIANQVAWVCALGPNAVSDYSPALQRVEMALARQRNYDYTNTLGTVLFRAGRLQQSIQVLQEACAMSNGGTPSDWLILAMANYRLGRTIEARQWLAKASQAISVRVQQAPVHPQWIGVLEWRLMLAEANSLIGSAPD